MNINLLTEQKINDTLIRLSKLSEKEYISTYLSDMKEQINLSEYITETADSFELKKDSKSSLLELCFQVLNIYKDNFKNKYTTVSSEVIIDTIKKDEKLKQKMSDIYGVDIYNSNVSDVEKRAEEIKKDIEENPKNISSKYKKLLKLKEELENKQYQKNLYNYCMYSIDNDKYIIEEDKVIVALMIEIIIISLENQINGHNK